MNCRGKIRFGLPSINVDDNVMMLSPTFGFLKGMRFPPPGPEGVRNRKGHILKFDFNNPDAGIKEVKIVNEDDMPDLNPHGLSLYQDKQTGIYKQFVLCLLFGKRALFVQKCRKIVRKS